MTSKTKIATGWILVLLMAVLCAGCPPSSGSRQGPKKKGQVTQMSEKPIIEIQDGLTSVWMPIHNTFVSNPGQTAVCTVDGEPATGEPAWGHCKDAWDSENRAGVLIQLGRVNSQQVQKYFFGVRVTYVEEGQRKTKKLNDNSYDWLDIKAREACPIDPLRAYALFPNGHVKLACESATVDPPECARDRSIHKGFEPTHGAITYWTGDNHYTMTASYSNRTSKIMYTFELGDPVTLDQWNDGCFVQRFEDVRKVEVLYRRPDIDDIVIVDPPADGGSVSRP